MSHKCGAGCYRKQTPSTRKDCPSCGSGRNIVVHGETYTFSKHFYDNRKKLDRNFTEEEVEQALIRRAISGICRDRDGKVRRSYWGRASTRQHLLRVVVELNTNEIVSVFQDSKAPNRIKGKDKPGNWFQTHCGDLEVIDASLIPP